MSKLVPGYRITRFEVYYLRAREGVTGKQITAKLQSHVEREHGEAMPHDVEFRYEGSQLIRRVTKKKKLPREIIGVLQCWSARCYWREEVVHV